MNVRVRITQCLRFILIACCVALLTGCLDAETTVMIAYDAATDTFTYLVVYQQIRGLAVTQATQNLFHQTTQPTPSTAPSTQPGDDGSDDILALQKNRANLIVWPFPSQILIDPGLLKRPDGRADFCNVANLSTPADNSGTPNLSTQGIRIIPGGFFERGKDNLCFYQAAVVPGKLVDDWIDLANKSDVVQTAGIQQAIDGVKSAKSPRPTWPQTGKYIADFFEQYDGSDSTHISDDPSKVPLSTESLQLLLDQAKHQQFKLHRRGSVVAIDVKLTREDVDGAMQIIGIVRKAAEDRLKALANPAVQQTIKNGVDGVPFVREELAFVDAVTFAKVDPQTLRIQLGLIHLCTVGTLRPTDSLMPLGNEADWASNTAQVAEKTVPIDAHTTVEQLQANFLAGKLTGNPR